MNRKDACAVLGIAVLTAGMAGVLFWPAPAVALGPGDELQALNGRPTLKAQGCAFSVHTDKARYNLGEAPRILIEGINPQEQDVSVVAYLSNEYATTRLFVRRSAEPEARQPSWVPCRLTLAARRAVTLEAPPVVAAALGAGTGRVVLRIENAEIRSADFAVGNTPDPKLLQQILAQAKPTK
jgi:hypothetical protein